MTQVTAAGFSRDVPSTGLGDRKRVAPVRREGAAGRMPGESARLGVPVSTLCPTGKGLGLCLTVVQDGVGPAPCPLHGETEAVGMVSSQQRLSAFQNLPVCL